MTPAENWRRSREEAIASQWQRKESETMQIPKITYSITEQKSRFLIQGMNQLFKNNRFCFTE